MYGKEPHRHHWIPNEVHESDLELLIESRGKVQNIDNHNVPCTAMIHPWSTQMTCRKLAVYDIPATETHIEHLHISNSQILPTVTLNLQVCKSRLIVYVPVHVNTECDSKWGAQSPFMDLPL